MQKSLGGCSCSAFKPGFCHPLPTSNSSLATPGAAWDEKKEVFFNLLVFISSSLKSGLKWGGGGFYSPYEGLLVQGDIISCLLSLGLRVGWNEWCCLHEAQVCAGYIVGRCWGFCFDTMFYVLTQPACLLQLGLSRKSVVDKRSL